MTSVGAKSGGENLHKGGFSPLVDKIIEEIHAAFTVPEVDAVAKKYAREVREMDQDAELKPRVIHIINSAALRRSQIRDTDNA